MEEFIDLIKNFIIENNIIQIIIPISIPFILFHIIMNIFRYLTYNETMKTECIDDEVEIIDEIPVILNNDVILSNDQFIKF